MLEGMRLGTVDAGVITNAVIAQIEPAFQLNDLPFLYENEAQAQRVLDGPVGQKLAAKLEAKGIKLLGWMEGGFRNMINNVRPVDEARGRQGREVPRACRTRSSSACSRRSAATPCRWPGARPSRPCSRARSTGWRSRSAVIDQNKYFEVTKYLSITNHTYSAIPLLMAKRAFDKLPDDLKKVVIESGAAATKAQREAAGAAAKEVVAQAREGRHEGQSRHRLQAVPRLGARASTRRFKGSIGPDLMQEAAGRQAVTPVAASPGHEQSRPARRRTRHRVRRRRLEVSLIAATAIMVGCIALQVVMRYVFGRTPSWTEELAVLMFSGR